MKSRFVILFLLAGLAIAAVVFLVTRRPAAPVRPNILLIVSDDQGYADAGFQGSNEMQTPNLDRLAASGIRFSNGYASHPFCSPTRAGLLTGRYPQRFGHEGNPLYDPADHSEGLPLSEKLLPEYLAAAGYATGWIGKWHLGTAPEFAAGKRGFQETFGFVGGGHHYQDWHNDSAFEYSAPIERNGVVIDPPVEHLTTVLGHEAAAFVQRHQGEPWFLYLALSAPHIPHDPTPERRARFANIPDQKRRLYAAQLSLMDDAIGETLDALHDTKQQKDTLVIFFSDNGGAIMSGANNSPLRGGKGSVYEGGVRVPFVISWPALLNADETDERPVSTLDVFATALSVAGLGMPTDKKYDSVNLIPFLSGENSAAPHEQLFWRSDKLLAIRQGNWKLVRNGEQPPKLFDLASDIGEKNDIASEQPQLIAQLSAMLANWNNELIAPVFTGFNADREGNIITRKK